MTSNSQNLFRAHSTKYLNGATGIISNPNLQRRRMPRDTPTAIHQILSEWFLENFDIDYRGKSLFCTGDMSIAAGYRRPVSTLITLRPLGDYSVCFSTKCKDLFGHSQFYWSGADVSVKSIRTDMEALDFVHQQNCGLEAAATSGHEVMLVAERFQYAVVQQ